MSCNCDEKKSYGVLRAVRDGIAGDFVESDEHARRLKICKACPDYLFTGNCRRCGCFVTLKSRLRNANCDSGKW